MNKTKKAIKALEDYLGRDTEGLRLLEQVTRLANDTRTDAAHLKEACDSKDAAIQKLQSDLAMANTKQATLTNDVARAESQILQLRRQFANAMQRAEQLQGELTAREQVEDQQYDINTLERPSAASVLLQDARQLYWTFKQLRKDMKLAPVPDRHSKSTGSSVYDLVNLITSLSSDELLKLGRFVAVSSLFNFAVTIRASDNLTTSKRKGVLAIREKASDDNQGGLVQFVKWFRTNIADSDRKGESMKNSLNNGRDINGVWYD